MLNSTWFKNEIPFFNRLAVVFITGAGIGQKILRGRVVELATFVIGVLYVSAVPTGKSSARTGMRSLYLRPGLWVFSCLFSDTLTGVFYILGENSCNLYDDGHKKVPE